MSSTRLPGKVMIKLNGQPLIKMLYDRLNKSKLLDEIVIATGPMEKNFKLIEYMEKKNMNYFCGSETDVLNRYAETAKLYNPKTVVRITSDCPFSDPNLVDAIVNEHLGNGNDYTSNIDPATFPDGLDVEVFNFETLDITNTCAKKNHEREHVTPYMRKNRNFKKTCFKNNINLSKHRWTLDTVEDLHVIKGVCNYFYPRQDFEWQEILKLYKSDRNLFKFNKHLDRNYITNL